MGLQNKALLFFPWEVTPKALWLVYFLYFSQSSGHSLVNQYGYGRSQCHRAGNWKLYPLYDVKIFPCIYFSVPLVSSCLLYQLSGDLK